MYVMTSALAAANPEIAQLKAAVEEANEVKREKIS